MGSGISMMTLNAIAVLLAQTQAGRTNQTSWEIFYIVGLLIAFAAAVVFVRRARRAHGDPPVGSVPEAEVRGYIESGRMTPAPRR